MHTCVLCNGSPGLRPDREAAETQRRKQELSLSHVDVAAQQGAHRQQRHWRRDLAIPSLASIVSGTDRSRHLIEPSPAPPITQSDTAVEEPACEPGCTQQNPRHSRSLKCREEKPCETDAAPDDTDGDTRLPDHPTREPGRRPPTIGTTHASNNTHTGNGAAIGYSDAKSASLASPLRRRPATGSSG